MFYSTHYESPLGRITLASDGNNIVGVWNDGQKYFAATIRESMLEKSDLPEKKTSFEYGSQMRLSKPSMMITRSSSCHLLNL